MKKIKLSSQNLPAISTANNWRRGGSPGKNSEAKTVVGIADKNLKIKVMFHSPKQGKKLLKPILMRGGQSSGIELLIDS